MDDRIMREGKSGLLSGLSLPFPFSFSLRPILSADFIKEERERKDPSALDSRELLLLPTRKILSFLFRSRRVFTSIRSALQFCPQSKRELIDSREQCGEEKEIKREGERKGRGGDSSEE